MLNDSPVIFELELDAFCLASNSNPVPIYYASDSSHAVIIAVNTFADDLERVTGMRPSVKAVLRPSECEEGSIVVGTVTSDLLKGYRAEAGQGNDIWAALEGKWECWDVSLRNDNAIISGSDRRGVIYGLYTLSAYMGVSPWYWWGDVAVIRRDHVYLRAGTHLSHGEPTVKYRGFFLNDEQPVLWNWAYERYNIPRDQPPFQTGMYEKVFELCLRLKGNYMWPAMWCAMFAVDGQDISNGMPKTPTPGPNQVLAESMGIVMGTSHHEPMSRNQREYTLFGEGPWDYVKNGEWLRKFWEYGAERVKAGDCETMFTVGMRGDGDIELGNSSVQLLERVTADQQAILKRVLGTDTLDNVPQMWAMYKEVMGYFANGLHVPQNVVPMLADDNWGNLMAVMPEKGHKAGGGIYYHADYVGDPRSYKWINTVSLAKMWEQLNVAISFNTTQVWILNVGDLKMLETPLEWFLDIAYDSSRLDRESLLLWLAQRSKRDFHADPAKAKDIAKLVADYSILASRCKAELLDDKTYSLIHYDELERNIAAWSDLEARADIIYADLLPERKIAFFEMVLVSVKLQANLNHLYSSVAKSNVYATQSRSAANLHADLALELFERDADLADEFHLCQGGKWNHMLSQPHIGYQYWQGPTRQSLPPTSRVSKRAFGYKNGEPMTVRVSVENCFGAWPGDNKFNCPLGYDPPDPTLLPMDRYGRPRWIEIYSVGPREGLFTVTPRQDWVHASVRSGTLTPDGRNDVRVWLSIDWDQAGGASAGHVDVHTSDGIPVVITLPLIHGRQPPPDFHGSVLGDGYVAIEAARYTSLRESKTHAWQEIPYYGRTASGLAILPVGDFDYPLGEGPAILYEFWLTTPVDALKVPVTIHLGPALNYILGKRLAFGIQLDNGDIVRVEPVPEAPLGSLPHDWEEVVAAEIRKVTVDLDWVSQAEGKHTLRMWGVTTGILVERVLLDFGGISARGESYLGPPASVVL